MLPIIVRSLSPYIYFCRPERPNTKEYWLIVLRFYYIYRKRSRASVAIWIVKKRKTHQADKVDILLFMMVYEPT